MATQRGPAFGRRPPPFVDEGIKLLGYEASSYEAIRLYGQIAENMELHYCEYWV